MRFLKFFPSEDMEIGGRGRGKQKKRRNLSEGEEEWGIGE
jgi:hypothetical protein